MAARQPAAPQRARASSKGVVQPSFGARPRLVGVARPGLEHGEGVRQPAERCLVQQFVAQKLSIMPFCCGLPGEHRLDKQLAPLRALDERRPFGIEALVDHEP